SVPIKPTTNSLLLTGSDADVARARQILASVDVRPAQINYEAKVTEINLNSLKNLGLTYDFSGASTRIGELPDNVAGGAPKLGDNGYPGKILKSGVFGRTALSNLVTVGLNALFTSGDAKLLSNPNISAVDGQPAAAFIGDTVRYVSSITQTPTGQTVTTDSVNIGIKLFVTGKVNNDGYITLNIHPEVSTITGYLAVPGGGSLPQVSTREATTTVRVKDGDTIAIGGLISENDIKNVQKVPFLGDLPFFGNLFKNTSHTHRRDEVVIFVKVSISKDGTVSAS
ncbi:MAG: type II and III secretion system protein, partial [Armatimonadota bacterium]|nr:type II and III secretion system protein [Armatimonadota bacterium]